MTKTEKAFYSSCDKSSNYHSLDDYKNDIVKWLALCSWHYSEDAARKCVEDNIVFVKEAFDQKEPVSSIGLDIGYGCG